MDDFNSPKLSGLLQLSVLLDVNLSLYSVCLVLGRGILDLHIYLETVSFMSDIVIFR